MRLVSRAMQQHGGAELALRLASVVQVGVDQHKVPGLPARARGRTEEREGREAGAASTREERTGFERRVREPKSVRFEEGECSAVREASGVRWNGRRKGGSVLM